MHKRLRPLIAVIVLLVAAAGWWMVTDRAATPACPTAGAICASGMVEAADEVTVAAEIGGIIRDLPVDEGAEVRAGDVVARLDEALIAAQIERAQAGVKAAQAALDQLIAGARPEDRRAATAALAQAVAVRDGAKKALDNALAIRDSPQDLDGRISVARVDVEIARHLLAQAQANRDAAQVAKEQLEAALATVQGGTDVDTPSGKQHIGPPPAALAELRAQVGLATNQWWAASEGVNAAAAALSGAEQSLADLLDMRASPIALDAQVSAAQTAYENARAAADAAQARLLMMEAGATAEQITIARAQVEQARAAAGILEAQRAKLTLRSPITGIVVTRPAHVGEMASPGAPLMTIANLTTVELKIYIPESQLGRVRLGQAVVVTVDSFPGRSFAGEVAYISSQAEFTPKNVQTKQERVNLVFAAKVRLPNPDLALKPGMPADAAIQVN